jgi:hypothetical protein
LARSEPELVNALTYLYVSFFFLDSRNRYWLFLLSRLQSLNLNFCRNILRWRNSLVKSLELWLKIFLFSWYEMIGGGSWWMVIFFFFFSNGTAYSIIQSNDMMACIYLQGSLLQLNLRPIATLLYLLSPSAF